MNVLPSIGDQAGEPPVFASLSKNNWTVFIMAVLCVWCILNVHVVYVYVNEVDDEV